MHVKPDRLHTSIYTYLGELVGSGDRVGLGRCVGRVGHGAPARARGRPLHAQPDRATSHEPGPPGEWNSGEGLEDARFTTALVSHDTYLVYVRIWEWVGGEGFLRDVMLHDGGER